MRWRLGVAGYPIEHSLSPRCTRRACAGGTRAAAPSASSSVASEAARLGELMGTRFDALSITMPLKDVAGDCCDSLDAGRRAHRRR